MSESVKSVSRALAILDLLGKHPAGLGVTEIAREMKIAKSTVHRLLTSLASESFVEKDDRTQLYKLGLKLLHLGNAVAQSLDIRAVAQPFLQELVRKTNETIHLAIYDRGEIVYIEKLDGGAGILRMYSQVGLRAPAHCTGLGKAILSQKSVDEIQELIDSKGLQKFTDRTITSMEQLIKELKIAKENGFAIDDEEHERGIRCAAAPIFDYQQKVVAAVSVAGPTTRISGEDLKKLCEQVKEVARAISRKMGMYEDVE